MNFGKFGYAVQREFSVVPALIARIAIRDGMKGRYTLALPPAMTGDGWAAEPEILHFSLAGEHEHIRGKVKEPKPMMVYDIIMIVVLLAATAWGIYKGLAWQIASIASIVLSYFVAYQFRGFVAEQINAAPPWNMFLSMLILYLGTSLVIWVAFRLVKETIDKVKLKEFDQHVGGVLGFAKGVVLCIVITLFAVTLMGQSEQQHIIRSYSGYCMAVILDKSHAVLPVEMNDQVHALIHKLDDSLPEGYEHAHEHADSFPTQPSVPVGDFNFGAGNHGNGGFVPSGQPDDHTANQPTSGGHFGWR